MKPFYITTTIPYVNAAPHVGHALEFVQCDAIARYRKTQGDDVRLLSGADENAIKNVQAAEAAGEQVQEFVNRNAELFRKLLEELNVGFDDFIKTTEERHIKGAQALWLAAKDDIYKKTYSGLYCVGCELFYKPGELDEKGECFEHPGKKLETVEEENYFFKLSKYETWLKDVISNGEVKIFPEKRKNEVLGFINQGLDDFSVSRPAERTKNWGVPVPGDDAHRMYVWFDALSNYITALGYPNESDDLYKKYWTSDGTRLHALGKGVSRFHSIYWLAMLKSARLPLPTDELIHGYVTIDGAKMSKTVGNVVDPSELVKKYGADAVRYFLLREIPTLDDGDFSEEKFKLRYNADLANGLGNFSARVTTLADGGRFKIQDLRFKKELETVRQEMEKKLNEYKLNDALAAIWELISFGDAYLNNEAPWKKENEGKKEEVIGNCVVLLKHITELIAPFIPETSEKILNAFSEGGSVKKIDPLFPRLS